LKAAPKAAPQPDRKTKKTKKAQQSGIAEESAEITDADFAGEIATASDADLLSLLGEVDAMSETWRTLLLAEMEKRGV